MPTVAVDKAELWERLGQEFTTEEFDTLCFEYGVELDEDTTAEVEEAIKKGLPAERPQLKIETPANRYDLLCIEGIARALKVFLGKEKAPRYMLVYPPKGESDLLTVTIHPETKQVRPLFACAILRNIKFTPRSYASFIDLQDKLHQNICRRRQLVAIGTHDLDTLKGPFRYEARAPKNIKFAPLNKEQEYTAEELMNLYESDKQLSRYLHIIRDSPVYPIIYDAEDRVLSMPPIINSNHSKITLNTTNVFIDVTATDQTKLDIVVNMVATMFSEYCAEPFTIEPVKMVLPDGTTKISPDLSERTMLAHASYINSCTGLSLKSDQVANLLSKMSLFPNVSTTNADEIEVSMPPTRPDIFHECDIMEDAAIAYGFNNLPHTFPPTTTVGQPSAINKLSDIVRLEWALAGWVEVLPLTLCSHEENFAFLNHEDDNNTAVKIANPKTLEFQVVRTTLIPGLLKTIRENRSHSLPLKIFETGDVVFKDIKRERQSRNERHAAAVWCNKTAGFEIVHGVFDRAMKMLEIPRISSSDSNAETGYYMKETSDPMFFPGRAATIYYRSPPLRRKGTLEKLKQDAKTIIHVHDDLVLGTLGILHPSVLEKFDIQYPCSAVEFTLDPFKKEIQKIWTNDE
ncbi:phenylalanyl-tRNA synthetase subunit beta [Lentinula edodes]|uniref:Phenylalanine--tRNA ligase beta subunit n=1 Tax=Lentinula edodes TaxID=5353 RepID=A0A1Q3DVJ5_LENED|nr:phenylalanyl-tRNA synthetase subunit beta [Lentinula edodes]KAH7876297.1 phenylalanyl-tRNA synthetase subunit beta [Lentinula edodes]KAJ3909850.1 phenylalanyl-tRNA synthetase subunit beta [Lentinula edodes]KAJ3924126.1 phenylalanyl-tRNA synthetase subunit beta [Lentinula edodes]GAV98925.1 phenylalanyl-tRNA synthetase subunit beta [Lentinula edodes]